MNARTIQLKLIEKGESVLKRYKYRVLKYTYVRPMIRFVSESIAKSSDLVGVEIGVCRGDNAGFILSTLPIKKLFLIDPYVGYEKFKYNVGWTNHTQSDFNDDFRIAKERLKEFEDKIKFIRKKSEDAAGDVPDDLDFVYIDGNHDYEFVKRDVELYYPKVKRGGVLGGDNFESIFPSVPRAVLEFVDKHDLKIHGARSAASYEWWVIKK